MTGLPGIGLVSKMAVDHLARETAARRFATLYSPHFPNQVLALKNGKIKAFSMRFYEKKFKHGSEVVFLRGDLQPLTVEGQYEVTAKILRFARSIGVTRVIAMAGYAVQKTGALSRAAGAPAVYCAATSESLYNEFKRLGAKPAAGIVPIVGMAGLVPTLAPVYGMHGACLLVETPGTTIDPRGAKALVSFLGAWLGEKFDAQDLEKRARRTEKMLRKFEEQAQAAATQQSKAGAPAAPEPIKRESLSYIR
ncbi:MAG: PAC2 family protein [Candidatus Norongarragalinales archaeon]